MNGPSVALSLPPIPYEVQDLAVEKGVSRYLNAVVDLARQVFPSSGLVLSLGQDAEDETHRYIAINVEVGALATEELVDRQRIWSAGLARICPSPHAVYFVLGWR